jgi:hypothetical protein
VIAISPPLQVRENSDGSVIVYVAIQIHGHDQNYGELLPPASLDVTAAIAGVAFNYGISIQCAVDCIRQVKIDAMLSRNRLYSITRPVEPHSKSYNDHSRST